MEATRLHHPYKSRHIPMMTFQVRSIQCLVRVKNVTSPVDGALCDDAGLEAPVTYQRCGFTECPQWHFGEWSECESSRCFTLHYGEHWGDLIEGSVMAMSEPLCFSLFIPLFAWTLILHACLFLHL